MHFHLPKPLHGWRAFAGEVGIIVVGVLIALGAEQVVEDIRWHQKVAVVRRSLMDELGNDRARWETDMAQVPCQLDSIDKVDRWARDGGSEDVTAAAADLSNGGFLWMHSANWQLATASETLDHFPMDEQLAFATVYDGVAHRQIDIEKGADLFERIGGLISVADNAQGRRGLRAALGSLEGRIAALTTNANYMRRHFDALGVKSDNRDFAADLSSSVCGPRILHVRAGRVRKP
jgi:hypothetical protein